MLAIINVLIGGAVIKIVDVVASRNKHKLDEIAEFRQELINEIRYLREQWYKCEVDLEKCREDKNLLRKRCKDDE